MHPALRSIAGQLGRRIVLVAIAIGAVIAFIAVAGGTGAQNARRITIAPITVSRAPAAVTSPPADPALAASSSSVGVTPPSASANPSPSKALTKAAVRPSSSPASAPAVIDVATTPARAPSTRAHGRGPRGGDATTSSDPATVTTAAAGGSSASNYQYSRVRDVAAVINPPRAANGWTAVTTTAATTSAGCVTAGTCTGQVGPCGFTPASIGSASTSVVYDGQYRNQYGDCLELVSF